MEAFEAAFEVAEAVFDIAEYLDEQERNHIDGIVLEPLLVGTSTGGATTTTNTSIIKVVWSDVKLQAKFGSIDIPKKSLTKCATCEYFSVGDIVKATTDIPINNSTTIEAVSVTKKAKGNAVIPNGTRGTLQALDEKGNWMVDWYRKGTIGVTTTTVVVVTNDGKQAVIKKCDQSLYLKPGDVVKAAVTIPHGVSGKEVIPKGTIGTITARDQFDALIVAWGPTQIALMTDEKNIKKCDQTKYFKIGDIIQAKSDLIWTNGRIMTVPIGTFGTLKL